MLLLSLFYFILRFRKFLLILHFLYSVQYKVFGLNNEIEQCYFDYHRLYKISMANACVILRNY